MITEQFVDFALWLRTDGDYEIRIGSTFSVRTREASDTRFTPEADGGLSPPKMPSVLGQIVAASAIDNYGSLLVDFEDGTQIRADPDEDYESWTIAGPHGLLIVCTPGGELAVWGPDAE
jgi:hypothetical protein